MANPTEKGVHAPERELVEAARIRRRRDLELTMSERLERVAVLCKQASQVREQASARP